MIHDTMQRLSIFGLIQGAGADARAFLQGQLSHDLQRLTTEHTLLTSCNSPQGRVQAVLTVIERSDGILLLLPASMVASTLVRLRKYVLRAKVTLKDVGPQFAVFAAGSAALRESSLPVPAQSGAHAQHNDTSVLRWRDAHERYLVIAPADSAGVAEPGDAAWRIADIRAGLPQVLPETHESFVAQMLNLDLLDGISFNKGCYTGQEVIARTHYRGAIKRRMFRLQGDCAPPAPGVRVLSQGAHAGDVVMSAAVDGGCELLAVLSLAQINNPLELEQAPGVPLRRLSLPYDIPLDE